MPSLPTGNVTLGTLVFVPIGGSPPGGNLPSALEPPTMPTNPEWLWLSPESEAIVSAIQESGNRWMNAQEVADAAKIELTTAAKNLLAELVKRKILLSDYRRGYRINLPETKENN